MRGVYKLPQIRTQIQTFHQQNWCSQEKFGQFSTGYCLVQRKNYKKQTLQQNFTNQETEFSSEIIEVEKGFGKTKSSRKELAKWYTCTKGEDSNVRDI